MNPRYLNALDQIYHSSWAVDRLLRQRRLRAVVERLWPTGHPTRLVQVGGTSGKGSVSRFLEAGFGMVGVAGCFTGPHLFDYRERFRVGGATVEPDEIATLWGQVVLPLCLEEAERTGHIFSFFDINILLALVLFERAGAHWATIEVGVGGRYDRTSALSYVACALTNVGRDHEHLLGSEPWQRALNKAGMAHAEVPFFTSEHDPTLLEVIGGVCAGVAAPLHLVGENEVAGLQALAGTIPTDSILSAEHQQRNAALALALLSHLLPDLAQAEAVQRMARVQIVGRLSEVEPGLYADVAHNPDKVAALAREIVARFGERPKLFVVGVSGSRQASDVLTPLLPLAHTLLITHSAFKGQEPQAIRSELLALHPNAPIIVYEDARAALAAARALCPADGVIILTGSTYMLDQALNPDPFLRHINGTYGWRKAGEK